MTTKMTASERAEWESHITRHAPATPLPWESTRRDDAKGNWTTCDIGQAVNYGGAVVARALGPTNKDHANAAYIAHAANAYPRLVEALRAMVHAYDATGGASGSLESAAAEGARKLLRAVSEL